MVVPHPQPTSTIRGRFGFLNRVARLKEVGLLSVLVVVVVVLVVLVVLLVLVVEVLVVEVLAVVLLLVVAVLLVLTCLPHFFSMSHLWVIFLVNGIV